jgi:hypothetical protein
MLSQFPRIHRYYVRTTLVLAWLFAAGAGFAATTFTAISATVVRELGLVLTIVCGVALSLGGIIAAAGVLFKHYRWEWWSAYFSAFGISPYVFSLWYTVLFQGEETRTTQALLVTSLFLSFLTRAALCGAHAARLRAIHIEGEGVTDAIDHMVDKRRHQSPS